MVSTQEDNSHQRRHFRAAVELPVTIIVPGHELILSGIARDVSRGGMRVTTTTDLPAGQAIVLRFLLPGSDRELLMRGKVVLSFFDASTKQYAHGIAFTQYTPADLDAVARWVAAMESQAQS